MQAHDIYDQFSVMKYVKQKLTKCPNNSNDNMQWKKNCRTIYFISCVLNFLIYALKKTNVPWKVNKQGTGT